MNDPTQQLSSGQIDGAADRTPMPKDICCRNFKGLLAYIRKHYGEGGLHKLTDGLFDGDHFIQDKYEPDRILAISENHLGDSAYWVSNEFSLALLANVNHIVRSPSPLYTAGCAVVQEDLSKADLFMARLAGVKKVAKRAASLNARFNKTKDVRLLELDNERAVFELRYRPGFRVTKDVCQWNLGIYVGVAQLAGVARAAGREVACVLNGDGHCRFEITWRQRNLFARLVRAAVMRLFPFATRGLVAEYEKTLEERDLLIDRLSLSEEKYRRLFEDSLDPMSVSQGGKLVDVNRAWLELHGFALKGEVVGKDVLDFIHPDDRQILSGRRVQPPDHAHRLVQMRDITRSGQIKSVEVYSTCLTIGGEKSILATIHDISPRKQAEEDLRGIEKQLRLFIENTPAAVAICDRKMRYLAYSRRWIEDYHLPYKDLVGRCHYDVFESIPEKWKREHQRCFAGEIIEDEEEPFRRSDGTLDWVRRKVYPWRDGNDSIGGLIMFTEVITQRKLAESALRESEEKYRKLVENATDAIFIVQDEIIKFPNPKAIELFGYREEHGQSVPFSRYIHPDDRAVVFDGYQKRLAGNDKPSPNDAFRFIDRRGSEFVMQLNAVPIEWEGRPAVLSFLKDITEQVRMSESLRQSQKFEAIGTLAGGIAHDFNNLLMGIQGRASLIAVDLEFSNPQNEHLDAIGKYVRSATDLTKQLLGFARGGKYEVVPIDINELVLRSSAMFGRTRKEINVHNTLKDEKLVVEVDSGQIEQVLLNMYVNAWQAMPDGGDLYLGTRSVRLDETYCQHHNVNPGDYAKISITDSGIGMDKATALRIFDPFFTTKAKGRGTGLGLASAFGIVKNHNGTITVYSEVGHGTTFNIYLPVSMKAIHNDAAVERGIIPGTETILLVDDEKMIVDVGKAMLEKLGYRVITATGGDDAVKQFQRKENSIDLVILDMIMPGRDGGKTFDALRGLQPDLPVILSSGYSLNGQASKIMERGCNGFIQKPFNIAELSQTVRKILAAT